MTNILKDADAITSGSRNKTYGSPLENHTRTSRLWKEYLDCKFDTDIELNADDVCYLNVLQKISRSMHDPNHRDTWVDIAGYARNLQMMREDQLDDPYSTGADNIDAETLTETFAPIEDLTSSRAARKPSGYVYLACPYTHDDSCVRARRAHMASMTAAVLMDQGMVVFSPITHGHYIAPHLTEREDHSFWMAQCLPFLARADKLFVLQLPGWTLSRGIELEMQYAKENGIPIEFIEQVETTLG